MYFRCELIVDGVAYEVSDNLKNWDDVSVSYKRSGYDGIVRTFSTKFEFVNGAYSLLKREYRSKYLSSSATVVLYKRNNSWLWNEIYRCALDFSTLSDDGTVISINAVDDSLASLIKAQKGTQYEYPVSELREEFQLFYDRLSISNYMRYAFGGTMNEDGSQYVEIAAGTNQFFHYSLPVATTEDKEILPNDSLELSDISLERHNTPEEVPVFMKANRNLKLRLSLSFEFSAMKGDVYISIRNEDTGWYERWENAYHLTGKTTLVEFSGEVTVNKGQGLKFSIVDLSGDGSGALTKVNFRNFSMKIEWMNISSPVYMDVIKPVTLLNRLLKSINGEKEGVAGEIVPGDTRLNNALVIAAESVRDLPEAKIYPSYDKFCKWMESEFGYVPVVSGNKVAFVHRDSLYKKTVVKEVGQISDFEYHVNSSLIYSRLKVGYDKQDYDSINGRDEFRFTNEYTTGNTLTDNVLELVSPFRADAYGMEFLAQKRGEDTTDNESDNDVFFVCAKLSTITIDPGPPSVMAMVYALVREGFEISGVISPDTMFNAMYSQRYMIEANRRFIGASVDRLVFASSDGNSDIAINGVKETDDILISDRLFTVGEISFETSDQDIPSDWAGRIRVRYMGETYDCHVLDDKMNALKGKTVKYSLIVDEII